MKIILETNLKSGDYLYRLDKALKRIYRNCNACDGTGIVYYDDYEIDCPECKKIKHGNYGIDFIDVDIYTSNLERIAGFICRDNFTFDIRMANGDEIDVDRLSISKYGFVTKQYYKTEQEMKSIKKELNKIAFDKENKFLKGE